MKHLCLGRTRQTRPKGSQGAVAGALLGLSLLVALAALAAACGGSSQSTTPQASGQKVQVLATVTRGDLVDTVMARLQLTKDAKGGAYGTGPVTATSAKQVSTNQSVTVYFLTFRAGARPGSSPYPTPSPGQSTGAGGFGQGGFGQGGGGFDNSQFLRNAKHATGTVTSISYASNGSATVHVTIAKLPAGVTNAGFAMAQLSSRVLATNVLLLPTAAISGSGSNATVQLLVNGKTQQQHVVVGKQTLAQAEIVSGVSQGDSVVYTRTFNGRFPGGFRRGSGSPFPGGGFGNGSSAAPGQ